jgi:Zn-finger nucleic acid-binding protein
MSFMDYLGFKTGKTAADIEGHLDCPKCKKAMIKLTREGVTIDKCLTCGGIWLDKGEIFSIIEKAKKSESKKTKR